MRHKPLLVTKRCHWIFDATNVPKSLTENKQLLTEALKHLAKLCEMNIVAGPLTVKGIPSNPGFTAVCVVDFSHLVIHTFSNPNEVCVDIFSCKMFDPKPVHQYLLNAFGTNTEDSIFCDVKYPHEYPGHSFSRRGDISVPRRFSASRLGS